MSFAVCRPQQRGIIKNTYLLTDRYFPVNFLQNDIFYMYFLIIFVLVRPHKAGGLTYKDVT